MERKTPYRAELNGQTCASCYYWRGVASEDGSCQRYPPAPSEIGHGLSPKTNSGFWCGEWRRIELSTL